MYALRSRGEQEKSPDVVTCMLQVFSINVYDLLGPGTTLYIINHLVAMKVYVLLDVFHEPFFYPSG